MPNVFNVGMFSNAQFGRECFAIGYLNGCFVAGLIAACILLGGFQNDNQTHKSQAHATKARKQAASSPPSSQPAKENAGGGGRTENKQQDQQVSIVSVPEVRHQLKSFLSAVFTRAKQLRLSDGVNPMQGVAIPKNLRGKSETFAKSLDEIRTMLAILPEPSRSVVAVAGYAGLRRGEIQTLIDIFYQPAQPTHATNKSRITHAKRIAPPASAAPAASSKSPYRKCPGVRHLGPHQCHAPAHLSIGD
jgi:hypothetical protein